jgi:hypothetical protein
VIIHRHGDAFTARECERLLVAGDDALHCAQCQCAVFLAQKLQKHFRRAACVTRIRSDRTATRSVAVVGEQNRSHFGRQQQQQQQQQQQHCSVNVRRATW